MKPQAMANPVYDRIDVVTLTLAVVLAAGVVFLLAELVPQLADLMMPPPLSGPRLFKIAVAEGRFSLSASRCPSERYRATPKEGGRQARCIIAQPGHRKAPPERG